MSINEEKLEMWCKQVDKRLDGLERKVGSIDRITATLISNYARESCLPEPKEPLIKDEKIRKAVRAWAEANDIEAGLYDADTFSIGSDDNFISFNNGFADETRIYTIAELCGEDEE